MQTRASTSVTLGAALLLAFVAGCCQTNCPRTIRAIATPDGWTEISKQTPRGATVSLAVPESWQNVPAERPLMARKAVVPTNGFQANVIVVVDPFSGTLDAYVEANKRSLVDDAEIKSDGPVRLGDREAYELRYVWQGPPQSSGHQLIEVTGEEAISVTCSVAQGDGDALHSLCDKVFATSSIDAGSP